MQRQQPRHPGDQHVICYLQFPTAMYVALSDTGARLSTTQAHMKVSWYWKAKSDEI